MLALRGFLSLHSLAVTFDPLPTPLFPTQIRESALLSSVLSAAITNPNQFTFGGVIAECVKTVFAP